MANTARSLWPGQIGVAPFPEPAKILREQGRALSDLSHGQLYGEVLKASFPSTKSVTYDFYVGATDKPYRHKLLSIEVGLAFDYPLTLRDSESDKTLRVASEDAFEEQISRILQSDVTQNLLERLMVFAK